MIDSMATTILALGVALVGLLAAILVPAALGRCLGFVSLGVSALFADVAAIAQLRSPTVLAVGGSTSYHTAIRLDATAAFFIATIASIAIIVALYGIGRRNVDEVRTGRTAAASACAIFFASMLACLANDVLLFIFAWELLALTFFWAIGYAGTDRKSSTAAYFTLVVTHVAGALVIGTLLYLAHVAGTFAIDGVIASASTLTTMARGVMLVLLLVGFGVKFGMLPFYAWMPYGYRSTPSVVAAIMAGGALNVGFYAVVRFIIPFPAIPVWFAILVVSLGACSAFFGIAWAAVQNDVRRLAALSSVENGGVILAALGLALTGRAIGQDAFVGLGLAAAALQIVAHAFAKTTLFLSCSTLSDRCGSTSLTELGGLMRRMPYTAVTTLVSALSLAALPPLAGFASEWFVLEALMQAFRTGNVALEVALALGAALIGVSAGIAIVTFTKLIGIGFLGTARTPGARSSSETPSFWKRLGSVVGALCVLGGGIFAPQILTLAAPMIDRASHLATVDAIVAIDPLLQPGFPHFSSASPIGLFCLIAGFTLLFWFFSRSLARPVGRTAEVWTSGERYRDWTQYTGTGYSNATRVILDAGIRTKRHSASIPSGERRGRITYRSEIRPLFDLVRYRSIASFFFRIARVVRASQSGVIAAYLSYILIFTILMLVLYPSIRHW